MIVVDNFEASLHFGGRHLDLSIWRVCVQMYQLTGINTRCESVCWSTSSFRSLDRFTWDLLVCSHSACWHQMLSGSVLRSWDLQIQSLQSKYYSLRNTWMSRSEYLSHCRLRVVSLSQPTVSPPSFMPLYNDVQEPQQAFSSCFRSLFDLKSPLRAALWLCRCWHLFLCCGAFRAVGNSNLLTLMISSLFIAGEAWIHAVIFMFS